MVVYKWPVRAGLFLVLFLIFSHAVTQVQGAFGNDKLKISGSLVNSGCSVSLSNSDHIVLMGDVRSNQFLGVGSDSRAVPFSIQLDDCDSDIGESVGVTFTGLVTDQDVQVLAITPGVGAATGIGLALFNVDDQLLPINTPPLSYTLLNKGTNTLRFLAKYRLVGQPLVPGVANALTDFVLTYQ